MRAAVARDPRFERDAGVVSVGEPVPGTMTEPHNAQDRPCVADSGVRREDVAAGVMSSWPAWMADMNVRRVSQFKPGAKSRRTVGSLGSMFSEEFERISKATYVSSATSLARNGVVNSVEMRGI